MISKAKPSDKLEIYHSWKSLFAFDDYGSIDFFFANYYDKGETYVIKTDNHIVSSVCVFEHPIHLMDKVIQVSYLVGIYTIEKYQNQGYMRKLLDGVLHINDANTLMSILMAYNPELYQSFKFEPFIDHQVVQLSKSMVPAVSTMNITYQVDSVQLLENYKRFMRYFDGYKVRTVHDFDVIKKDLQAQNGKLVGYVKDDELLGYMMYVIHDYYVEILEIVYFDVDMLMRLLYFAANINQNIKVHISTQENWKNLFPRATIETQTFIYGRINDISLFNDLYELNIQGVNDLFRLVKKPLFFNEFQ
ncbi:MAG: GNAT family N-acetyltransferase [Erysipelothrix sp.]|nr:GNAT family N-acetyltransferase [Erysipelothrix sp.]